MVNEDLSENLTTEPRSEWYKDKYCDYLGWGGGGSVHVKEKPNAKSPETGTFLRNSKKASVAGVE